LRSLSHYYKRRGDSGVSFLDQRSRFYVAPLNAVTVLPAPRAKSSARDQNGDLAKPPQKELPK